jgi:hypothetical protein
MEMEGRCDVKKAKSGKKSGKKERAGLKPGLYNFQEGFQLVAMGLRFIQSIVCDPESG